MLSRDHSDTLLPRAFLRSIEVNAHATIVGLYLNAVADMSKDVRPEDELDRVLDYLGKPTGFTVESAQITVFTIAAAAKQVRDGDKYFDQWVLTLPRPIPFNTR